MEFCELANIEEITCEKDSDEDIMVSILCITYNHKDYIRDAIEGFINQKANFKYEIVIFDDASTDGTSEIIKSYTMKYPNLIKACLAHCNTYNYPNRKKLLTEYEKNLLSGKYVALCEGDDYWINTNKLQMQVDYLETHMDCVMTVHDAIMLNCITGERIKMSPYQEEKNISPDEIIMQYHGNVPTASMVYRREILDMADFFLNVGVGDYPLQLFCLTKGAIHYFDIPMCLYRYSGEGAWTSRLKEDEEFFLSHYIRMLSFLEQYDDYTKYEFNSSITGKKSIYLQYIIKHFENYTGMQFVKLCNFCNKRSNLEFERYYKAVERVFLLLRDKDYIDKTIQTFVNQYSHIVIWGAGKYGKIVAQKIEGEKNFEGFAISNDQEFSGEYLGKPVWKIRDMPFGKKETGIVVAVGADFWREVQKNLNEIGNLNYIYPFLI